MSKLLGNNWRFYALIDGVNYPIGFCETTSSITTTTNLLEKTTKGSNNYNNFRPGRVNTTATVSGVCALNVPAAVPKLRVDIQQKGLPITCTFSATDQDGHTQNYGGVFYIVSITETANLDAPVTYDLQLQCDGALTINYDPFNPTPGEGGAVFVKTFDAAADGQTVFTDAILVGKIGLLVFADGVYYRVISGPPSAGNLEAQFDNSTGTVTLPVGMMIGADIDVVYKTA